MSIFKQPNLKNHSSRSGFDLSHKVAFTAKCGELLPIMHRTVMPGDKFKMSVEHLTRTLPLETSAFTRFREYFDFFFVPYKQLYRHAPQVLTQMQNNSQYASGNVYNSIIGKNLPWTYMSMLDQALKFQGVLNTTDKVKPDPDDPTKKYLYNHCGFRECLQTGKLYNYLGYGFRKESDILKVASEKDTWSECCAENVQVSLLPFAAYQKIYYDFYRFDQWENNNPIAYNFDYLDNTCYYQLPLSNVGDTSGLNFYSSGLFTLRYCNYPKDLFFGMLPSPQYGETADFESSIDVNKIILKPGAVVSETKPNGSIQNKESYVKYKPGNVDLISLEASEKLNVLKLRQAQALQRYKEIVNTGNQDYKTQIEKIYGVSLPSCLNNQAIYLGGFSSSINIQEVTNTNLSQDNIATMQGKGYGMDNKNKPIDYDIKEHGIIMCIYHVLPLVDYALDAFQFDVTKTEVDDFANPVFDKLGYQELPLYYLDSKIKFTNNPYTGNSGSTLGYVPRYFDYKTSVDTVLGSFRETLPNWLAPIKNEYLSHYFKDQNGNNFALSINYKFFKVNPHICDTIFFGTADDSVDSDQFLINSNLDIKAVRNLDYNGLPY